MQRPKRACTERAKQRIQEILQWEACTEDSQMFKDVEAQMEHELESEVKTGEYVPSSSSGIDSNSDDDCSETETEKKEEPFDPTAEE